MACESCSSKGGGTPAGCRNNGHCSTGGCNKLEVFDWLSDMELPGGREPFDIVEVRFKNGRKAFYRNVNNLPLYVGDAVAVEASPGYDVGVVTIAGELVRLQMEKRDVSAASNEIRKVYRKARPDDLEKWKEARGLEEETMHRARKIALRLGLDMKISDVEYQGDRSKATFYYTAEGRVDFRELIKVLAEEFKIRIEMRQIGARQEAARLGGIGSCGRELCCSTWLTDFRTVSTSAARYQQLSLNPQKLAGQCGKLKCCLNYELDMYVEVYKGLPESNVRLQTKKGLAVHQKTDIFKRMMWYSVEGEFGHVFVGLKADRVREIIQLNRQGVVVDDLEEYKEQVVVEKQPGFDNVVGQDSLTRFDEKKNRNRGKGRGGRNRDRDRDRNQGASAANTQATSQPGRKPENPRADNNRRQSQPRRGGDPNRQGRGNGGDRNNPAGEQGNQGNQGNQRNPGNQGNPRQGRNFRGKNRGNDNPQNDRQKK